MIPSGFLDDILAHPADDTPRLILCDWLEEHGEENDRLRAEFIRLQIEAHRRLRGEFLVLPETLKGQYIEAMRGRWREILRLPCIPGGKCNEERWFSPFDEARHPDWSGWSPFRCLFEWEYRRGFVEQIVCPWAGFERYEPELCAEHPLREVVLTDWRPDRMEVWNEPLNRCTMVQLIVNGRVARMRIGHRDFMETRSLPAPWTTFCDLARELWPHITFTRADPGH